MPRALTRPTDDEIVALTRFIRVVSPTGVNRWHAVAVEAWARGKTTRAAAIEANAEFREAGAEIKGNQTAVVRAIRLYRQTGLDAFRGAKGRSRGRAPIPAEKVEKAVCLLRDSISNGTPLTYLEIAQRLGISKAVVGRLAQARKLDSKHRRGKVAHSLPSTRD